MKIFSKISVIILVVFAMISCGEIDPLVVFEKPIKGRIINLSNKVGDSFQVIRENDTILYSVFYDKETSINYLLRSSVDTVFVGTVTKRNELFLLNSFIEDDDKYAIHALKFTDSTVIGLETAWLQSSIISRALDSGLFSALLIDTVKYKTLSANKKDGKRLFRYVVAQLTPEKLVSEGIDYMEINNEKKISKSLEKSKAENDIKLIYKVYPNPFIDNVTIKFNKRAIYLIKIYDIKGSEVKSLKANTDDVKVELGNLLRGSYILKVMAKESGITDEIKLIKN